MEIKRFERVFLLFAREDGDINNGQNPSGYVKLEAIQGRIKLTSIIQGLREDYGKDLMLYLFSQGYGEVRFFNAGNLIPKQSKYELIRDIFLDGSNSNNDTLRNVDGAVIVWMKNTYGVQSIFCPLVAFKNNKKFAYKEDLARILSKSMEASVAENTEKAQIEETKEELTENTLTELPSKVVDEVKEEEKFEVALEKEEFKSAQQEVKNVETEEESEFEKYQNMLKQFEFSAIQNENKKICMEPTTDLQRKLCEGCEFEIREDKEKDNQLISVSKLIVLFDKNFEHYDPFRIRNSDYRWWKVGSPVQLNNLLYQNNIKTPLLFNPQLMMAHFKYRHILVGTYSNRRHRKEYVVCGVPAVYNIDEKPFGEYCRWAQLESMKPRHGAFGYWLVYIDIKTGNFLGV